MKIIGIGYGWLALSSFFTVSFGMESGSWNRLAEVPGVAIEEGATHPYEVAEWDKKFGNHRARIAVDTDADAVQVRMVWRRRDIRVEEKNVFIYDPVKKERVANRAVLRINREVADIVFEPTSGAGTYEVYYLQNDPTVGEGFAAMKPFPITQYYVPEETADERWLQENQLETVESCGNQLGLLPRANVIALQALALSGPESQREFNSFYPMEVIATESETMDYVRRHAEGQTFLLFPEGRNNPIKMPRDLPLCWIQRGAVTTLSETVAPNEYVVFQVGVYALDDLENVTVQFSDLTGSATLPASDFRCFNTSGTDWLGEDFEKSVAVEKGAIQSLWCGIQIPENQSAGLLKGTVSVAAEGVPAQTVQLQFNIAGDVLEDRGDSELQRLSRLRWLDSKIGLDEDVVYPYIPIEKDEQSFEILGRNITLGRSGLPEQADSRIEMFEIKPQGRDILAKPMSMEVSIDGASQSVMLADITFPKQAPGVVTFEAPGQLSGLNVACSGVLEADGYLRYRYIFTATKTVDLEDIALNIPVRKEVARYASGAIQPMAGRRPASIEKMRINPALMYSSSWVGDFNAGIAVQLKNHDDEWNADNRTKHQLPRLVEWFNKGRGFYALQEREGAAVFSVHTGEKQLKKGESFELNFALYITPFKPIEKRHWDAKVYHQAIGHNPDLEKGDLAGIYNIHHANILNPYINYPFISTDQMKGFVEQAHARNKKVKIYYTVRELSVRAAELWALRSFGDEILIVDEGWKGLSKKPISAQEHHQNRTGHAWHAEHLVGGYRNRWHSPLHESENNEKAWLIGPETDSSIAVQGLTRWHNYYLEGLAWLRKNVGVDGLYLDGIGYDRAVMKRVRKAMQIEGLPPSMIDFHGAVNYAWIQHAPYIDSIWFGEGAKYSRDPDYWLVEVSGIPFGLTGEILGNKPDRSQFRGMIYGMSRRYGWHGGNSDDALALWKLWDEFGIAESEMIGWWQADAPVKTSHPDVWATAYVKEGETLIALGSWADEACEVTLDMNWEALGLDPKIVTLQAPELDQMQEARTFEVGESLPVAPGQGWIIWVK